MWYITFIQENMALSWWKGRTRNSHLLSEQATGDWILFLTLFMPTSIIRTKALWWRTLAWSKQTSLSSAWWMCFEVAILPEITLSLSSIAVNTFISFLIWYRLIFRSWFSTRRVKLNLGLKDMHPSIHFSSLHSVISLLPTCDCFRRIVILFSWFRFKDLHKSNLCSDK